MQSNAELIAFNGTTGSVQLIEKEENLDFSAWLTLYQSGDFSKIELINDTDLRGYQLLNTGKQQLFFGKEVETQTFSLLKTTKSAGISLLDLGVALTGDKAVVMKYEGESFWSKMIGQVGYLAAFLVILIIGMRFVLPK